MHFMNLTSFEADKCHVYHVICKTVFKLLHSLVNFFRFCQWTDTKCNICCSSYIKDFFAYSDILGTRVKVAPVSLQGSKSVLSKDLNRD